MLTQLSRNYNNFNKAAFPCRKVLTDFKVDKPGNQTIFQLFSDVDFFQQHLKHSLQTFLQVFSCRNKLYTKIIYSITARWFLSTLAPETEKQIKLAKYKICFELKQSEAESDACI